MKSVSSFSSIEVSDTQVTVKACGPLVLLCVLIYSRFVLPGKF